MNISERQPKLSLPDKKITGEERLARYTKWQDALRQQRANIQTKLTRGTEFIKEGHRIGGINPDRKATEVCLSPSKRRRLMGNLKSIERHLR